MPAFDPVNEKPSMRPSIDEELAIAGREFAEAVRGGDGAKVVRAYKALKAMCEAEGEAEDSMDESGEMEQY